MKEVLLPRLNFEDKKVGYRPRASDVAANTPPGSAY